MRILLVDDDEDVREVLSELLTLEGHTVTAACDGPQGVLRALQTTPEVAFIDLTLPGIDGVEVARRIRAVMGSSVVLVALSGHADANPRGFDARLTKPSGASEILGVLDRVSAKRRMAG
jgi:CheY-like chemotaxis protein